jgi:hypothetical protein
MPLVRNIELNGLPNIHLYYAGIVLSSLLFDFALVLHLQLVIGCHDRSPNGSEFARNHRDGAHSVVAGDGRSNRQMW